VNAAERLIAAMHSAGGIGPRLVTGWLELAQLETSLRDAFRVVFGKRLPTPARLGLWLSERMGMKAGDVALYGRHSPKHKAWAYWVMPPPAPRPVASKPSPPAPAPKPKPEQFETETTIDRSTGAITTKPLINPRTGEPIKKHTPAADTTAVSASTPGKPAAVGVPRPTRIPKVFENGKWREMTPQEYTSQTRSTPPAGFERGSTDWFIAACAARNGR
jgi:hypothetical protein